MQCRNHPATMAADRCSACMEAMCGNCLITFKGQRFCGSCKMSALGGKMPVIESATQPCKEAAEALKTAFIGIFCFGFILGLVAVNKANQAKKLIEANPSLTGTGKANAAIAVGIMVFIVSLLGMIMRMKGKF